jgi:hypothetical protein
MKKKWCKAVFSTKGTWPKASVTVHVFFTGPDEYFVPATSLGQGLAVNPESIPVDYVSDPPDSFDIDKRVRNVIWCGDNMRACVRDLLRRKQEKVDDADVTTIIDSIVHAIHQTYTEQKDDDFEDDDDDDDENGVAEEDVEEVGREKTKKRPRRHVEHRESIDLTNLNSNNARRGVFLDPQEKTHLVDQIARTVEGLVHKHTSYETQQAAVLMLYNSPEFQAKKKEYTEAKLRQIGSRVDIRAEQLERRARDEWTRNVLPGKIAQWEREARQNA